MQQSPFERKKLAMKCSEFCKKLTERGNNVGCRQNFDVS